MRRDSAALRLRFQKPLAPRATDIFLTSGGFTPSREARFWREWATAAAERIVGLSRDRDRRFSLSPAALAAIARGGDR